MTTKSHRVGTASLISAGLILCAGTYVSAAPTTLSAAEKRKVRDAIVLLEQAWKDCLSMKLIDVKGSGAGQMEYEKITKNGMEVDPTFQDAINHLKNMLDRDNLVQDTLGGFGTVDVQPGVDNDKIIVAKRIIEKMCDMNASGVDRMDAKFQLIATLANELSHVFQKWSTATNAQRCDGERDSDTNSVKALDPLLNAMSQANGTPHTSILNIYGDPQYVLTLGLCMTEYGVTSQANIAALHAKLKAKLGQESATPANRTGYKGRRQRFGASIAGGANWATWYYGGHDEVTEGGANEDETTRTHTTVVGQDLIATRNFPVPPELQLVTSRIIETELVQLSLVSFAGNIGGQRAIQMWRDDDSDGLPEPGGLLVPLLPPAPPSTSVPIYSAQIVQGHAPLLSKGDTTSGLFILDRRDGSFFMLETLPDGMPAGPPIRLFQSPLLLDGQGFEFLTEHFQPSPSTPFHRFVFRDGPYGDQPAAFFDVFFDLSVIGPQIATLAQARMPNNLPGVNTIFPSPNGPVVLTGNPGQFVVLASIGRGFEGPLAAGITGPDGRTPPLNTGAPVEANDLFRVEDSFGRSTTVFLPRRGANIDCLVADETGDGAPDRLHLSVEPARLHFLDAGSPPTVRGGPTWFHTMEIALQPLEYGGFRQWNNVDGRRLSVLETESQIIVVPGFIPPPYVQTPVDFDNDGNPDEAVIIARFIGAPSFTAFFFDDIDGNSPARGGVLDQSIDLPPAFEPDGIFYEDLNGDSRIDVRLTDFDGGPDLCLLNSANPPFSRFSIGPCVFVPPCCVGNADKVSPGSVAFADVTAVLVNFGMPANPNGTSPGDADCNGDITFSDITAVLVNFGNDCP